MAYYDDDYSGDYGYDEDEEVQKFDADKSREVDGINMRAEYGKVITQECTTVATTTWEKVKKAMLNKDLYDKKEDKNEAYDAVFGSNNRSVARNMLTVCNTWSRDMKNFLKPYAQALAKAGFSKVGYKHLTAEALVQPDHDDANFYIYLKDYISKCLGFAVAVSVSLPIMGQKACNSSEKLLSIMKINPDKEQCFGNYNNFLSEIAGKVANKGSIKAANKKVLDSALPVPDTAQNQAKLYHTTAEMQEAWDWIAGSINSLPEEKRAELYGRVLKSLNTEGKPVYHEWKRPKGYDHTKTEDHSEMLKKIRHEFLEDPEGMKNLMRTEYGNLKREIEEEKQRLEEQEKARKSGTPTDAPPPPPPPAVKKSTTSRLNVTRSGSKTFGKYSNE